MQLEILECSKCGREVTPFKTAHLVKKSDKSFIIFCMSCCPECDWVFDRKKQDGRKNRL